MFLMALTSAPALEIPDLNKLFTLFSPEKQGLALGILAPKVGPVPWLMAYLSKQVDPVASSQPLVSPNFSRMSRRSLSN